MRIAKWFLEPVIAVALFIAWIAVAARPLLLDSVPLRTDTEITNAYAVAMAVGLALALAISRFSPRGALALVVLVLIIQFLGWPARFSNEGWTAYGMIAVIACFLAWQSTGRTRLVAAVLAVPIAAGIAALLNLAPFSLSGQWGIINGKPLGSPEAWEGFIVTLLASFGVVALLWYNVTRVRMRGQAAPPPSADDSLDSLSPRERDVYLWVASGMTNAEIASVAHIEESTVKSHVTNVLAKLRLTSRTGIVAHAYRAGVLQPEPATR